MLLEIEKPNLEFTSEDEYGKFVIEPMERGYGITLGNALRRVLLSSLPGCAPTHVRIEGVLHEFSTIPGVMEDTTEIVLNLKKLIINLHTDMPKTLRLEAQGEGVVTAADIRPDPEVEILNPDLKIATLDGKDSRLAMEIRVDRGQGYVPAERHILEEEVIGQIPMDSIFTPIRKVNYLVEDTRVGQITNYDKLILEVWTDGSIKPYEAVSSAANLLKDKLDFFANLRPPTPSSGVVESGVQEEVLSIPVENMGLSVRSLNCLRRAGVKTIGELMQYSEEDIMKLKNFGMKSLHEIKDKLTELGLNLRSDAEEQPGGDK